MARAPGRGAQTERLAGAVERFVYGSGGRVEVSKCRAVHGTAFASDRAGRGFCVSWVWVSVFPGCRAGCANGAKRSAALGRLLHSVGGEQNGKGFCCFIIL